jgi:hypothetical protein
LCTITSAGRFTRRQHLRHREGLARAGDAEQHLRRVAAPQSLGELLDRARLVARQLERTVEFEAIALRRHRQGLPNPRCYRELSAIA